MLNVESAHVLKAMSMTPLWSRPFTATRTFNLIFTFLLSESRVSGIYCSLEGSFQRCMQYKYLQLTDVML